MKTLFDIVSLILFVGVAILYLQRSASHEDDPVPLWRYAVVAAGCAIGNYLGNHEMPLAAWIILGLVAIGLVFFLKLFDISKLK